MHVIFLLLGRSIAHVFRDVMQSVGDELDSFTRVGPFNRHSFKLGGHCVVGGVTSAALCSGIFFCQIMLCGCKVGLDGGPSFVCWEFQPPFLARIAAQTGVEDNGTSIVQNLWCGVRLIAILCIIGGFFIWENKLSMGRLGSQGALNFLLFSIRSLAVCLAYVVIKCVNMVKAVCPEYPS